MEDNLVAQVQVEVLAVAPAVAEAEVGGDPPVAGPEQEEAVVA